MYRTMDHISSSLNVPFDAGIPEGQIPLSITHFNCPSVYVCTSSEASDGNGGERTKAMIVDWQYEPIKGHLLHIDLKRIAMDKALRVSVPIELQGVPVGVKTEGGILEQMLREVEIECLPGDIPSHIDVDVSELTFGKVLRVADLPHNEKLKFISDANQPVAHVTSVKEEVVATPEAVAAEAGATPSEPEVIKKGKAETDEEGEAEKPEKKADNKKEKK